MLGPQRKAAVQGSDGWEAEGGFVSACRASMDVMSQSASRRRPATASSVRWIWVSNVRRWIWSLNPEPSFQASNQASIGM